MDPITFEPRIVDVSCKDCGKITRYLEYWYPPNMLTMHYLQRCYECEHIYWEKEKEQYRKLNKKLNWLLFYGFITAVIIWCIIMLIITK